MALQEPPPAGASGNDPTRSAVSTLPSVSSGPAKAQPPAVPSTERAKEAEIAKADAGDTADDADAAPARSNVRKTRRHWRPPRKKHKKVDFGF